MKRFKIIYLLIAVSLLASCAKRDDVNPTPDPTKKTMDELVISPNFKFDNSKLIQVDVTLPYTVDYTAIRGRVDFYYLANQTQNLVHSGLSDHQGRYAASFEVPNFVSKLYARSMGGTVELDLNSALKSSNDGGYTVNFGATLTTDPPPTPEGSFKASEFDPTASASSITSNATLKSQLATNLLTNGTFDNNSFGSMANWSSPMTYNQQWMITSQLAGKAQQYNDGGNKVLRIGSTMYGGVAQLITASAGQLITLTGDIKVSGSGAKYVWLYLIPRNASGFPISTIAVEELSPSTSWKNYMVSATMPAGTASCEVLLWINNYGGYIYYDNIVATGPNPDADHDGVIDAEDEYPADAARAYNLYYPASNAFATLAFEDNWPYKADYDFNDLVIALQHKMVLSADYKLVDMYSKFSVKAIGASFHNGFGFEMNMSPAAIGSITGQSITENYLSFSGNNTEAGQSKAVVIVSDNMFKQLPHPGSGTGVNTTPGSPYVTPDTLQIHVALATPVSLSSIGSAPFNPFIIVNQVRGREIHMIDHAPTTLADASLFGTGADNSQAGAGQWYKTSNNLPWCILLPSTFDYSVEKSAIIDGYLMFGQWAESAGTQYSDWYLPGIPGYRDVNYIYETE